MLSFIAAWLLPQRAWAQQPCDASGLDAFESARRARRIVDDYRIMHGRAAEIMALDDLAGAASGRPQLDTRVYAVPMLDIRWWPGLTACRDDAPRDASLSALRYGLLGGVELSRSKLGFEAFWLRGDDAISVAGRGAEAAQELEQAQSLLGVRARWSRWAELVVGVIEDEEPAEDALDDVPRAYLALGVPAINLRSDVILDRRDRSLQTLLLNLDALRLNDAGLALTARAGYLEDEQQVTTLAGLNIPLLRRHHDTYGMPYSTEYIADHRQNLAFSLYPELSVEWRDARVRHARIAGIYRSVDELGEDLGHLRFEMDVFADVTLFRSQALEARAGATDAFGVSAGGRVALGTSLGSALVAESLIGINRPETLAQVSELAGAREYRIQFYMLIPYSYAW